MKKSIAVTLISIIFLSILGHTFVASAENSTAPGFLLKRETVPEVINYEYAVSIGHIQRAYDEEDGLNSVVFRNDDGTNTMYLFNEDVKYIDDSGAINDKSNALVNCEDGSFSNKFNDIYVVYPNRIHDGITLSYNDFYLTSTPLIEVVESSISNEARPSTAHIDANESKITYKGAFAENVDLQYTQTFSGYKEEIILTERQKRSTFSFLVETNASLKYNEYNEIVAYIEEKEIGKFGSAIILDANNTIVNGSIEVEILDENTYVITISAPEDFLNSSSTKYPVVIDPSFNITTSPSNKTIEDATIFTNYSSNFGTWFTLFVGNFNAYWPTSSQQRGIARTLVKFPGLYANSSFNTYYNAGRINNVKMNFSDSNCGQTNNIRAYRYTKTWDESTVVYSSTLWNGYTTSNAGGSVSIVAQPLTVPYPRYEIDVTNIVNYHMSYPSTQNYGLMLKSTNETLPSVVIGSSEAGDSVGRTDSKPYLTINYNPMPSTETSDIISEGIYQIINKNNGKALSCSGTALSQATSSPSATTQRFKIKYYGNGKYEIIPMSNTSYRIGTNGSTWTVSTSSGSSLQLWHLVRTSSGYVHIHSSYYNNKLLISKTSTTTVYVDNSTSGADWTFRFICLDVPLIMQQTTNTCGSACGVMALNFYGITNVSESQFKTQAGSQYTYAYAVTNALNYFLTNAGYSIQYHYVYSTTYSETTFLSAISSNIYNKHPVLIQLKISDQTYFPYTTDGHYVLIVGTFYDSSAGEYKAVINDPHYNYCAQRIVPINTILQYAKAHGGCTLCVD